MATPPTRIAAIATIGTASAPAFLAACAFDAHCRPFVQGGLPRQSLGMHPLGRFFQTSQQTQEAIENRHWMRREARDVQIYRQDAVDAVIHFRIVPERPPEIEHTPIAITSLGAGVAS